MFDKALLKILLKVLYPMATPLGEEFDALYWKEVRESLVYLLKLIAVQIYLHLIFRCEELREILTKVDHVFDERFRSEPPAASFSYPDF